MSALIELYRRLDLLQRSLRFRIAASVAVLAAGAGYFGPLLVRSYSLQAQRIALRSALADQNLHENDDHAVSLATSGTVVVGGRTYGGDEFARRARWLFTEDGFIAAPDRLVEDLLADQRPGWAPAFLLERPGATWMLAIATATWLWLIVWMEISLPFVLTVLGTAVPVLISRWAGSESAMLAFAGMGLLTFTFVLLTRVALLLLRMPGQIPAVAHTVVKEATRNRLSLVFVVLLLVGLPLLPLGLDPDAPLRYRVQTFITRSLGVTYGMAACMTLFLSCASVAFEIRDRQIWQLMTKPLLRLNYLLGKWLGIVSINMVILLVAGVSIFTYVKYLSQLPVAPGMEGLLDRLAVTDEVLTARVGTDPVLDALAPDQVRMRVDQTIQRDPDLAAVEEVPLSVKRRLARELVEEHMNMQRSVPPIEELEPGGNRRSYTFAGLGEARTLQSTLTLRYRFHIMRDDEHETFPVVFEFNGDPSTRVQRDYIPTVTHVLPIGTDLVREDGTLEVTVYNLYFPPPDQEGRGALNFEPGDFELLYKVSSFEANFLRAALLTWVKLAFLAMLGIACSTALSFPVACLLSFTIFIAGTIAPFLAMSLKEYYAPELSQMDWTNLGMVLLWAFKGSIKGIAQLLVFALHSFGEYRPTQNLVQGRLISWQTVAGGFFWLVVVWSGVAAVFGYLVIRNRQLAIYSGHG